MGNGQLSARQKMQRRNADPIKREIRCQQNKQSYYANREKALERKRDLYHQRMATLLCTEVHAGVMY